MKKQKKMKARAEALCQNRTDNLKTLLEELSVKVSSEIRINEKESYGLN